MRQWKLLYGTACSDDNSNSGVCCDGSCVVGVECCARTVRPKRSVLRRQRPMRPVPDSSRTARRASAASGRRGHFQRWSHRQGRPTFAQAGVAAATAATAPNSVRRGHLRPLRACTRRADRRSPKRVLRRRLLQRRPILFRGRQLRPGGGLSAQLLRHHAIGCGVEIPCSCPEGLTCCRARYVRTPAAIPATAVDAGRCAPTTSATPVSADVPAMEIFAQTTAAPPTAAPTRSAVRAAQIRRPTATIAAAVVRPALPTRFAWPANAFATSAQVAAHSAQSRPRSTRRPPGELSAFVLARSRGTS